MFSSALESSAFARLGEKGEREIQRTVPIPLKTSSRATKMAKYGSPRIPNIYTPVLIKLVGDDTLS